MSAKSQEIWKHNSYLGHAKMMQQNCRSILNARTVSDRAKQIAVRIEADAELLYDAIESERIDK